MSEHDSGGGPAGTSLGDALGNALGDAVVGEAVVGEAVAHANACDTAHVLPDAGSTHSLLIWFALLKWYHAAQPPSTLVGNWEHHLLGLRSRVLLRPAKLPQRSSVLGAALGDPLGWLDGAAEGDALGDALSQ
jgi:hypothetical protein